MRVFIQLQSTTPYKVAKAFIDSVRISDDNHTTIDTPKSTDDSNSDPSKEKELEEEVDNLDNGENLGRDVNPVTPIKTTYFMLYCSATYALREKSLQFSTLYLPIRKHLHGSNRFN
jgi:hypothetical protein